MIHRRCTEEGRTPGPIPYGSTQRAIQAAILILKCDLDPGFCDSYGNRVDFTPEAFQRIARGARSATPGSRAPNDSHPGGVAEPSATPPGLIFLPHLNPGWRFAYPGLFAAIPPGCKHPCTRPVLLFTFEPPISKRASPPSAAHSPASAHNKPLMAFLNSSFKRH